jgi:hypothetical protein
MSATRHKASRNSTNVRARERWSSCVGKEDEKMIMSATLHKVLRNFTNLLLAIEQLCA